MTDNDLQLDLDDHIPEAHKGRELQWLLTSIRNVTYNLAQGNATGKRLEAELHRLAKWSQMAEALGRKAAVPADHIVVPQEPTDGLLVSMATRYDHSFGLMVSDPDRQSEAKSILTTMRQLHEEVVGTGFYRPELEERYRASLPQTSTTKPQT